MEMKEKEEEKMSRMEGKLTELTITELKEELKERQMKVGGIKKELVKRLAKRMEEEEEEEERREEERKEKFWIDDEKHTKKMRSFNSWDEKTDVSVQQWLKLFNF